MDNSTVSDRRKSGRRRWSTSQKFVLMDRRGCFYNKGRWVRTLFEAAKYDEQLAADLFRNTPAVKEMVSVSEVRRRGIAAVKSTRKLRSSRRRKTGRERG